MHTLKTSLLSSASVGVPVTRLKPAKNHSPYMLSESAVISSKIMPIPTDAIKRKKSFQSSEIGGLHVLSENPLPCGSFARNGESFLEGILLHLLMATN